MHHDTTRFLPHTTYEALHKMSVEDPTGFWGGCAEHLHWYKKWDKVLDDSKAPFYRWFSGGKTKLAPRPTMMALPCRAMVPMTRIMTWPY